MKAIAYLRVSTTDQGLEAQRTAIQKWADYTGADIVFFEDAGVSGRRLENRPALKQAVDAACKAHCPFVVYSLSRIARSTRDLIEIGNHFEKSEVDLISLTENIDTTSPTGRMVFRLLASLAEFERDIISERTKASLAQRRSTGLRISRHIPFGYDCPDGKTLIENEREQRAITQMVEMRLAGATLRGICEELNRSGIRSKRGGNWTAATIRQIVIRATA